MYAIIPQQIPQGMRAEVNEKILFAIDSGKDLIPAESIYNCYTGIGGLHNLKQSDFASYHEYAEAKKEFEMEQFGAGAQEFPHVAEVGHLQQVVFFLPHVYEMLRGHCHFCLIQVHDILHYSL